MTAEATYIATADALEPLISEWRSSALVGLDTEFIRTNTFYPIPALYQVATERGVWILDPLGIDSWRDFAALLTDPSVTKVIHACSEDIEVLVRHFGVAPTNVVDTQVAAAFVTGEFSAGYAALVERFTGLSLPKHETRSDWLNRPLSPRQLEYAAEDVRYLLDVWRALSAELERLGRRQWFEEENARRRAPAAPPDEYYKQVPSAWRLDRRGLARLKELALWREQRARERDMPRRRVLTDDVLLKLAAVDRLARQDIDRLVEAPAVRRQAAALMSAAAAGNAVAENALPPSLDGPLDRADTEIVRRLKECGREIANRLGLAEELLVRRRDLEACVREYRASGRCTIVNGWRAPLVGAEFDAILRAAFGTQASA
jgi:ribonuclease D